MSSLFSAGYFVTLQQYHDFLFDCSKIYTENKNFSMLSQLRNIVNLCVEEQYVNNYIRLTYYEYDLFLYFSFADMSKKHIQIFFLQFVQYQLQCLSIHLDYLQTSNMRSQTPVPYKINVSRSSTPIPSEILMQGSNDKDELL